MSFSTPYTEHLSEPAFDSVYEPAEDSFLFLDALQSDWHHISDLRRFLCWFVVLIGVAFFRPTICLEIGCGSGIVSTFVAQNLSDHSTCCMLCVDINPAALAATQKTFHRNVRQNFFFLEIILADLAASFLPISRRTVDLILFNPPYVVTSPEELATGDLTSKAWAGGKNGREVLDRFLPQAAELLSPTGIMYCVAIKENNIEDISKTVATYGLHTEVILTRRCRNELLHILRFTRSKSSTILN